MNPITIKIHKGVKCTNLPISALKKIEKNLTFNNPLYVTAMNRGTFIPADMSSKIVLFDIHKNDCWIPRGYLFYLLKYLRKNRYEINIQDHTLLLKPLNLKFLGKLKPYQVTANKCMLKYPIGVLEGGTGSGKTVVGISIIVSRQQPTLVIVHSKELLYQWAEEIEKFTGETCGLIGDAKCDIKPITIGIINSVRKKVDELNPLFGQIVIDECHKISSESWSDTLQGFSAKHYLGLTATPFRTDGLGHAIFASIGPKIHKINKKMLYDTKAILRPKLYRIPSSFRYMFTNDYSTMISLLTKDETRNRLICAEIARDLRIHNENIVVVSDRTNHCKTMQRMLEEIHNIKGEVLTGKKKKKDRKELTAKIKGGLCKVLFATIGLIGEGFDAPNLTVLFITTPIKSPGRLIQLCGRVLRAKKDKTPRIYDIRDNQIDVLKWSGFGRDRIYKKEWGKFTEG